MTRRVVVLWHERERAATGAYMITYLAQYWRADGIDVQFVFGARKFVPADVAIVHVDLSVVPEEYLELARRYPVAVNGRVRSIRRTAYSENLVRAGERWDGPVIVKSDLTSAGWPEQRLLSRRPAAVRLARAVLARLRPAPAGRAEPLRTYEVYDSIADVPAHRLAAKDTVVEKFLPERENGLYAVRYYYFLGDRWTGERLFSPLPVVKEATQVRIEPVEPHPAVVEWRSRLGFDYGKFDYVIRDGEAILLDANKTVGATVKVTPELEALRRHRAAGIHAYFR
jgi:hypothetical protein